MEQHNISVVINYDPASPEYLPGYVQFTRSGDRVYMVLDRKPIGSMSLAEFASVQKING